MDRSKSPTLRQMLVIGQLDADALVWNDSMPQWVAASQIPGLIPSRQGTGVAHGAGERRMGRTTAWRVFARRPGPRGPGPCFWRLPPSSTPACAFSSASSMLVHGADRGVPACGRHGAVLDRQRRGDCRGRNPLVELRQPSCQPDLWSFVARSWKAPWTGSRRFGCSSASS